MNPKKNRTARRERMAKKTANNIKFIPKEKIQYCKECKNEKHLHSEKEMKRINAAYDESVSDARKTKNKDIDRLNKENILTIDCEVMIGKSRCVKHYKPTV